MKKNAWKVSALAALAGMCMAQSAWAQAEACADAGSHPLTVGVPGTGNFTGSTNDGPTSCGGTGNLTQWWTFTAPATARYTIAMCNSAQSDTHLGVTLASAACSGTPTYIACNDDACGLGSQVVVDLTMGEVYRLRTATFGAVSNGGGYAVLITQDSGVAPMGDDCGTPLTAMLGNNPGNNNGATGTNDNSCGGTTDTNDVYFAFTAAGAGLYRFSTCASDFDTVMSVHTACPATSGNQVPSGCLESTSAPIALCGNRGSTITATLADMQTVFVRVAGTTGQTVSGTPGSTVPQCGFGDFDLEIAFIPAPANDDCANATAIMSFPFAATVDNTGANNSGLLGTCERHKDIWYTFEAPANGFAVLNETGGQDSSWGAYDADPCGGGANSVLCTTTDTAQSFPVVMGQNYWVRVGANAAATATTTPLIFEISIVTPPANDDCATAQEVSSFPFTATVANLAANHSGSLGGCERFGDVWYELVAPSDGAFTLNENGTQTAAFGVYDADPCADSVPFLLCNTTQVGLTVFPAFSGQSYWVRVGTSAIGTARVVPLALDFQFTAAPSNDACNDAATLDLSMGGSVTIDARAAQNDDDSTCNSGSATETLAGVWYTFATGLDGGVLNINETSTADTIKQLYTGADCGSLVQLECVDAENTNHNLTANTTYYMLLGVFSATVRPTVPYAFTYSFTPVTGACCVSSNCEILSASACATASGTFVGGPCAPSSGSNNTVTNIPDFAVTYAPITSDIMTSGIGGNVTSIEINVDIVHIFVGDLRVELIGPDATSTYLFGDIATTTCPADGVIGNGDDIDGVYTFSDSGSNTIRASALDTGSTIIPVGHYRAANCSGTIVDLNTVFAATPADGTWTLRVGDRDEAITGTLRGWSLTINGGIPIDCGGAPCPGDFNDDGVVDLLDLLAFNSVWSGSLGLAVPPGDAAADYNNDLVVDLLDLLAFNSDWSGNLGQTCP